MKIYNMKRDLYNQALFNDSEAVRQGAGKNIIPPPEKEPLWKAYLEKFKDPIIIVLLVVFFLSVCVSVYELIFQGHTIEVLFEPIGVLVALLLATGVGFIFEVKAGKEFEVLNKVKDDAPVKVFRRSEEGGNPHMYNIKRQDVVVGDIVKLESGDEVPADGILLDTITLRVDESNFTGEPHVKKSENEADFKKDATYPTNFLLRSSIVIEGTALYRVTAVGVDTVEAKGFAIEHDGTKVVTPLNRQLNRLADFISKVSLIIAIIIIAGRMLFFFYFDGNNANNTDVLEIVEYVLNSIMIAVTLIVVAVPEGLPMSVTLSLAMSMRRMMKENNLVRKLHACETMGAATVICTDKTGTLTKNEMTVVNTKFCGGEDDEYLVKMNMAVNSSAELTTDKNGKVMALGNPTEGAMLIWLKNQNVDYYEIRNKTTIISQVPFSTERKYMESTVKLDDGRTLRFVKGAPELLMKMCDELSGGMPINVVMDELASYQNRAFRTLGFAYQDMDKEGAKLIFLGVVGIADPIRDDVVEAIDTCRNHAGVRVIIVTGDTPGTANEIGREIGLIGKDEEPQRITGPEFAEMSHDDALALVRNPEFSILSRARPDDKARLVMLLQEAGEVVAVTGDGTNDAPALSKAQIGLSMGDGTARAKEASAITILDNSFSSINKAILWGRSLYMNIKRFILFQMTINVSACLIVMLGASLGIDSPLTVTQMLWVNLIMDTFAAMALSSLPADKRVMNDKPRNPKSHIIDRSMLGNILCFGLLFTVILLCLWQFLWHNDVTENIGVYDLLCKTNIKDFFLGLFDFSKSKAHLSAYEAGFFFTTFVMLQFWNLFNAKYFRSGRSLLLDIFAIFKGQNMFKLTFSKWFALIVAVILLGQIVIINFVGPLFNVAPLNVTDWLFILLSTSLVLIIVDVVRTFYFFIHNKKVV